MAFLVGITESGSSSQVTGYRTFNIAGSRSLTLSAVINLDTPFEFVTGPAGNDIDRPRVGISTK